MSKCRRCRRIRGRSRQAVNVPGSDVVETEVRGFMVLTQTCDISRDCGERPYIEVSPLVEVDELVLGEIERCRRPNYAFIPGLAKRQLVADLDRVMTVEKTVVASWERVEGCRTDRDIRRLSEVLARKRARVAFPDDFSCFAGALVSRMSSKHDKESDEGRALRALREIRVRAEPSWDAEKVRLIFWFIREDELLDFESQSWATFLEAWEARVAPKGRFVEVEAAVKALQDLTAKEYVESDPLDLDYLTNRSS